MIYISPDGNDAWSGLQHAPNADSIDGPLATLKKARDIIRELKISGSLPTTETTVNLREGTYTLSNTFHLDEQDSGTEQAPIVYCSFQNETARITSDNTHSEPLIQVQNAHHISFENLIVEHTKGDGILIKDGSYIQIAGCTMCDINNTAIRIIGGNNHRVQSCHIHNIGGCAIGVSGGNRKTLTRCEHTIENNHIHHNAQQTQQPCITISGVGIRTTNNHIHHNPHTAVHLSGNEHLVLYNHIHNVCLETEDMGAVYMQRDWTERGIRIQHNFFHDLNSSGVHMNDCASGSVILGNIFARCNRAVFIGGGRNHRIENNIFVNSQPAIQIDGRGLDNELEWHTMIYESMKSSFEAMNPLQPPYKNRYPELVEIAIYYQADTGIPPEGNLILRNICQGSEWLKTHWNAEPKMVALQNNITGEDPLFLDPNNDDYTLHEDSPAYELGFKTIPRESIGLYEDNFRHKNSD
jgi:hypothetical protein